MAVVTQNSISFHVLPIEVLNVVVDKLRSVDLLTFRLVCKSFNELLETLRLEPYNIWKKYIPHSIVFGCSKEITKLSEALACGNILFNELQAASRKTKKAKHKFLKVLSNTLNVSFSKIDNNNDGLIDAKNAFEQKQYRVSQALEEFKQAHHDRLWESQLVSFGNMQPNEWVKLQAYFAGDLFRLVKNVVGKENASPFIEKMVAMIYPSIVKSVYVKIIDQFVNAEEEPTTKAYNTMMQFLPKPLHAELNKKLEEKCGSEKFSNFLNQ